MQLSSDFRNSHKVVASFKVLRDVKAEADFSVGWGPSVSTPPPMSST